MDGLDAFQAEVEDTELFFHTHSPAENAEMASLLLSQLATAKADWAAARTAGDWDAAGRATGEWADLVELLAVAKTKMRDQARTFDPDPCMVVYLGDWA